MSPRNTFYISKTTSSIPDLPYHKIARHVLGDTYELSLVFVDAKEAQSLNTQYRGKDYAPDVLSFPLSDTSGEIFICPSVAHAKARDFTADRDLFIGYLFIHGLFHLKGMEHGRTMEKAEQHACEAFNIPFPL